MHDINRTQTEYEPEFEPEAFEYTEPEITGDTTGESPFDEIEETELATDLLEITDEAELDQFLGKLIKKASRAVRGFVRSPTGRALGGFLKGTAKQLLPIAGKAIGAYFGGPTGAMVGGQLGSAAGQLFGSEGAPAGANIGGQLGSAAGQLFGPGGGPAGATFGSQFAPMLGQMFGLELEGLSPEDQEYEVARQFVRLAGASTKNAIQTPVSAEPVSAAKAALMKAARKYAPGLVRGASTAAAALSGARSGRWIKRGRKIVLLGV